MLHYDIIRLINVDFNVVSLRLTEAIVDPPYVAFAVRPDPGVWKYARVRS